MPPVTGPATTGVDPEVLNRLSTPQAADAVRRGNVDEILKVTGLSRRDWEDYLKAQNVGLSRDIIQDYQIYSDFGAAPSPQWTDSFSPETGLGKVTAQDHAAFVESMGRLTGKAMVGGGKSSISGKAQEAPASLSGQVESYLQETDDLILGVADRALETQLQMQYNQESQKIRDEFLKLLAAANDPETILLALTQYKMREAGLIMTQAGRRVQQASQRQSRATDAMQKLSVDDPNYHAASMAAQQKVSSEGMNLNQQSSLMQTAIQNVESAMSFGHSAIGKLNEHETTIIRNMSVRS